MMRKKIFIAFCIVLATALSRCAKRGSPTGGPKDSIPPVLLKANPPLQTVNFDAERVVMQFDEYVQLNDITTQLIVSPPMDPNAYKIIPEGGIVSKKVEIRFLEAPRPNATYTFNFGSAIEDYNEKNPLSFFSYSFSTGDYIDSLSLSGLVKDAFALKADTGISIQLYPIDSTYRDSTIFLDRPLYVGNTLDSTYFNLQNLAPGKYEMIAIKDVAKNYFFDQGIDKIGFFDSPIELPKDSLLFPKLFNEIPNFQWARPRSVNDHHIIFGYYGLLEERKIELISAVPDDFESLIVKDKEKDSLHYWHTPLPEDIDSLVFRLYDRDTVRQSVVKFYRPEPDSLMITPVQTGVLNFIDTLQFSSSLPLRKIDKNYIQLYDIDTLEVPFTSSISKDKNQINFHFEKVPKDKYRIQILPNAITDFWGATNDTIQMTIRTLAVESYGTVFLKIDPGTEDPSYFYEILDKNNVVVRKGMKNEQNRYQIPFLGPGEYQVRIVLDTNENGQWDTGNYLEKRQPEEVLYLDEPFELRANWDQNVTITLEK